MSLFVLLVGLVGLVALSAFLLSEGFGLDDLPGFRRVRSSVPDTVPDTVQALADEQARADERAGGRYVAQSKDPWIQEGAQGATTAIALAIRAGRAPS